MESRITLVATEGGLKGQEFEFGGRAWCLVGRSSGCSLRLPAGDVTASRHHCLFDVDAPAVVLYDLGSRNGTYVNAERIRVHDPDTRVDPALAGAGRGRLLADGDEVRIGNTMFLVRITDLVSDVKGPAVDEETSAGQGTPPPGPASRRSVCEACC